VSVTAALKAALTDSRSGLVMAKGRRFDQKTARRGRTGQSVAVGGGLVASSRNRSQTPPRFTMCWGASPIAVAKPKDGARVALHVKYHLTHTTQTVREAGF